MGVIPMLDIPSVVPSGSSAMVLEEEDPLLMPWEHFEAIAAMKHCTSCRKNKKLEFFGGEENKSRRTDREDPRSS